MDALLADADVRLAVSCDGTPEVHDRHRRYRDGRRSSPYVLHTISRLVSAGREFSVVMVVRPDTVDRLLEGLAYLRDRGVHAFEPSLDLWATWTPADVVRLEEAVTQCADLWRAWLPEASVSWFDEKLAALAAVPLGPCARCRFGDGELAIAPSGRVYPCERLVGSDAADSPHLLPTHVLDGQSVSSSDCDGGETVCSRCSLSSLCNTFCRCSNYVRTGDYGRPDGLLCRWNKACIRATQSAMEPVLV